MMFGGLYRVDDVEEHIETRKSPCAAFQGEAAASHRGHCKKNNSSVFTHGENENLRFFLMMKFSPKWRKWTKYVKKLFMSFLSSSCDHHG